VTGNNPTIGQRICGLLCGAVFLLLAVSGLRSGETGFLYGTVKRSVDAPQFWFAVVSGRLAVACPGIAVFS